MVINYCTISTYRPNHASQTLLNWTISTFVTRLQSLWTIFEIKCPGGNFYQLKLQIASIHVLDDPWALKRCFDAFSHSLWSHRKTTVRFWHAGYIVYLQTRQQLRRMRNISCSATQSLHLVHFTPWTVELWTIFTGVTHHSWLWTAHSVNNLTHVSRPWMIGRNGTVGQPFCHHRMIPC